MREWREREKEKEKKKERCLKCHFKVAEMQSLNDRVS